MTMEIGPTNGSSADAGWYGDSTYCTECHKSLVWVRFSDGEVGYVATDDTPTCPDGSGEMFPHEPSDNRKG